MLLYICYKGAAAILPVWVGYVMELLKRQFDDGIYLIKQFLISVDKSS
jgi:hypothetical protein